MHQPVVKNHFLNLSDIPAAQLRRMLDYARTLKAEREEGKFTPVLAGKKLAMIFEKNSTRTRVSFEVAMLELGGGVISLNSSELQIGRGETAADTARVLSRYVDCLMLRCHDHRNLLELAEHGSIPVINGLSDLSHPCQLMADIMTFEERKGPIKGASIAWVGDGNNVAYSWVEAAVQFDFTLRIACPKGFEPDAKLLQWAKKKGAKVSVMQDAAKAVAGADAVVTDTWNSMGAGERTNAAAKTRAAKLKPYQVNDALMKKAAKGAIFLHCLPAHRGQEVTASVIDGLNSAVWDEAENRLHVQKSILLWCLGRMESTANRLEQMQE